MQIDEDLNRKRERLALKFLNAIKFLTAAGWNLSLFFCEFCVIKTIRKVTHGIRLLDRI